MLSIGMKPQAPVWLSLNDNLNKIKGRPYKNGWKNWSVGVFHTKKLSVNVKTKANCPMVQLMDVFKDKHVHQSWISFGAS